jgi:hypothetical protein
MPDAPDRAFDGDTLKLRAVLVLEEDKDQVSQGAIAGVVGYDTMKIPAVVVPEGGDAPGYPYERFGQVELPDEPDEPEQTSSDSSQAAQAVQAPQQDAAVPPPTPALAQGQSDPRAGIEAWRGMADAGNVWRKSAAGTASATAMGSRVAEAGSRTDAPATSGPGEQPKPDPSHQARALKALAEVPDDNRDAQASGGGASN